MGKLIPIVLAVIGLGGGVGAGIALRPGHDDVALENPCGDVAVDAEHSADEQGEEHAVEEPAADTSTYDYVKMNNQFIVPVVSDGRVSSLVVLSISLEVPPGQAEAIYVREPRLRDAMLQVMFDHANVGGFQGEFTDSGQLNVLRAALREVAKKTLGASVHDVLILDIVRQDT